MFRAAFFVESRKLFHTDMGLNFKTYLTLLLGLLLLVIPIPAQAQNADTSRVYLVTFGPGDELFERFGHNAIWIHDPSLNRDYQDVAFNYGLFNFQGDFYLRFLLGDMRYWMGGYDANQMIQGYRLNNRDIQCQQLNLTPAQVAQLADFLWNNSTPENRYYTYNYYTDNCSTRIRDALDRVLQGQIKRQTENQLTTHTWRFHSARILAVNPFAALGVDLLLGQSGDHPLSLWEEMYLPSLMEAHLRNLRIMDASGKLVPLVLTQQTIFHGTRPPVDALPPGWSTWFSLTGGGLSFALLLLYTLSLRKPRIRIFLLILALFWSMVVGLAGLVLSFMVLCTHHWATYYNENLLHFSPLALGLLFYLPGALRLRPRSLRLATLLAFLVFFSSFIGLLLKLTPWFTQHNQTFIELVLPVHAILAIILLLHSRQLRITVE